VSSSNTEQAPAEVVVEMPQMGVSVTEGTVALWHKQVGDWVQRDEIICEISTDKIDTDVPSPAAGRVVELLVAEEETVPVGTPLARIATDSFPGEAHQAEHEEAAAEPDGRGVARVTSRPVYSPVVQRIAAEHGLDLATIRGTGRGGRVRKQDVLALLAAGAPVEAPPVEEDAPPVDREASQVAEQPPRRDREPLRSEGGATGDAVPPREAHAEPLSRMRRAIAEHMTRSLHTAAHCTTVIEADFSRVERERELLECSPLPVVARAVIDSLQRHPGLNATLDGDLMTRHRDVNLGIAVSLGARGLIVPVIHRAQELSAEGLAARIRELAARARAGTLTPDEVSGGTFTITNPGGYGSIASTPIINQPQVAILDLEAVVKRPVVIADGAGGDAIAARPMAYLCLSWDHRALDGALAAQFLATLRRRLEGGD
jgi:pyruvate/2-oxoglutarate dehydrogenase complex dihydrolipoamide acyltransferase (E2) component